MHNIAALREFSPLVETEALNKEGATKFSAENDGENEKNPLLSEASPLAPSPFSSTVLCKCEELIEKLKIDLAGYPYLRPLEKTKAPDLLERIKTLCEDALTLPSPELLVNSSLEELKCVVYHPESCDLSRNFYLEHPQYLITVEEIYKKSLAHQLSHGSFGVIYKLETLSGRDPIVLKVGQTSSSKNRAKAIAYIENECAILKHIHESAKKYSERPPTGIMGPARRIAYFTKQKTEIFGYLAPYYHTDLDRYLLNSYKMLQDPSEEVKLFQAAQLIAALNNLSRFHVLHGDIKSANIFVLKREKKLPLLFLGDFGGASLEGTCECSLSYCKSKNHILSHDYRELGSILEDPKKNGEEKRRLYVALRKAMDCFAMGVVLCSLFTNGSALVRPRRGSDSDCEESYFSPSASLYAKISAPEAVKLIIFRLLEQKNRKRMKAQEAFEAFRNWLQTAPPTLIQAIEEDSIFETQFTP